MEFICLINVDVMVLMRPSISNVYYMKFLFINYGILKSIPLDLF
jgi:hypothetical protein